MKNNNFIKLTILLLLYSTLQGKELNIYNLFNNKFQAVFPSSPILLFNQKSVKIYYVFDKQNNLRYRAARISYKSIFKNDIIIYKKSDIDNMILRPINALGQEIISFNSNRDIKNKIYSYELVKKFKVKNHTVYISAIGFIYKREQYTWSIRYFNKKDRYIFNKYKQYSKVMK